MESFHDNFQGFESYDVVYLDFMFECSRFAHNAHGTMSKTFRKTETANAIFGMYLGGMA